MYYLWIRPDVQSVEIGELLQQLQYFVQKHEEREGKPIGKFSYMVRAAALTFREGVVVCGDFNILPDTTPYKLLTRGGLSTSSKQELMSLPVFADAAMLDDSQDYPFKDVLQHDLCLKSAYCEVLGAEPSFTDFAGDFKGTLDYILIGGLRKDDAHEEKEGEKGEEEIPKGKRLLATAVLGMVDDEGVDRHVGCPNIQFPSDHMSLKAVLRYAEE